jgi:hypothetical protein
MHWFFKFLIGSIFLISLIFTFTHSLPKLLPTQNIANSEINGLILSNQIWEGEIHITGDTFAVPGSVITIKPGTQVLVANQNDKSNFDFLPWHMKSGINTGDDSRGVRSNEPFWDEQEKIQIRLGKIYAVGSKEQPIIIKSSAQYPSPYDFNVFSSREGIISNSKLSHYRRFEVGKNFLIQNSEFSEIGECALCVGRGDITISHNTFYDTYRESIWIEAASPRITDNQFLNLKGNGIIMDPKLIGVPDISYNEFEMPGREALVLLTGGERFPGTISFNKFSGNSIIKLSCDSKAKFSQNSIFSLVTFIGSGCGGKYSFGPNYWGTMDTRAILQERITNKDRNFDIDIPSLLPSPPKEVGRRL